MTDNNNNSNYYDDDDDDEENDTFVCKDSNDVERCLDSSGGDNEQQQRRLNFTLHPQMEKLRVWLGENHKEDAFLKALSSNPHLRDIRIGMDI